MSIWLPCLKMWLNLTNLTLSTKINHNKYNNKEAGSNRVALPGNFCESWPRRLLSWPPHSLTETCTRLYWTAPAMEGLCSSFHMTLWHNNATDFPKRGSTKRSCMGGQNSQKTKGRLPSNTTHFLNQAKLSPRDAYRKARCINSRAKRPIVCWGRLTCQQLIGPYVTG